MKLIKNCKGGGLKGRREPIELYLLNIRRLKSWKSRSLFLSKNPSTEYLKETGEEEGLG